MSEVPEQPGLKQVLGAMLFAAKHPLKIAEMEAVLAQARASGEEGASAFAAVKPSDIQDALAQLREALEQGGLGLELVEGSRGYRYQTGVACGPWLRQLLNLGRPARLSHPALETLAIIAYRQPISRAEIEAVRGVNVDAMVRNLLELQLIRIAGRSEQPGRPILYGTTQLFLEHFGIKSVKDLPGIAQLARRDEEWVKSQEPQSKETQPELPAQDAVMERGKRRAESGEESGKRRAESGEERGKRRAESGEERGKRREESGEGEAERGERAQPELPTEDVESGEGEAESGEGEAENGPEPEPEKGEGDRL